MPKVYSYIRFSSPEQAHGNSSPRQLEAVSRYASEHGLEVDDSLRADEGVSAYDGSNVATGQLGAFLDAAARGEVERGSVLLVESLDRISRQNIWEALEVFSSIIRHGIKIVTLADQREYDEASITKNPMDLLSSLLILQRAHEESKMKSERLAAAWKAKRDRAKSEIMSPICPAWLSFNKEKNEFDVIPERAAIVHRIFKDSQAGLGQSTIARNLNEEGIPPWGLGKKRGVHWHTSSVSKILKNKAVLGQFQPHSHRKGEKRHPEGEPILDYFPPIIEESLFYEVQELRKQRQIATGTQSLSGTRKGQLSNLFTGLAVCGFCGAPMRFQSKGKNKSKSGKYLACTSAIAGTGCKYVAVRYEAFEHHFLHSIRNEEILKSLTETGETDKIDGYRHEILALEGKIADIDNTLSRLLVALETAEGVPPETIVSRISNLESEKNLNSKALENLRGKTAQLESQRIPENGLRELLRTLDSSLSRLGGRELLKFRTRLRDAIRQYFSNIVIYPRNRAIHFSQMELLGDLARASSGKDANPEATALLLTLSNASSQWPKRTIDRPMIFKPQFKGGGERLIVANNGSLSMIAAPDGGLMKDVFGTLPKSLQTAILP
ncbi:MAG: hypothetical protein CMO55_23100 [Verrucomicrobiales bacterium]|nr:hypothetical protein [Verrucomicrobiales bacterium]